MTDTTPLPNPKTFQAGDFIWPKKPKVYVPYNANSDDDPKAEEKRWIAERDAFIANASTVAPHLAPGEIERLRTLTYREFYARYAGDQVPGAPGLYASGGGLYVGHVGIIELDDQSGEPWVIEALLKRGVVRHSYRDWLRERPEEIVWHGRVRDQSGEDRAKIAIEAKECAGKPYDFWNFDLADGKAFYCSKLAWLAIYRALGFAIDGNPQPKRSFWLSPKQLLYLNTIARLHVPGDYASS
jgi:hypothetical protein